MYILLLLVVDITWIKHCQILIQKKECNLILRTHLVLPSRTVMRFLGWIWVIDYCMQLIHTLEENAFTASSHSFLFSKQVFG